MKDRAGIVAVLHVLKEVLHGDRRAVGGEFHDDASFGGFERNARIARGGLNGKGRAKGQGGEKQTGADLHRKIPYSNEIGGKASPIQKKALLAENALERAKALRKDTVVRERGLRGLVVFHGEREVDVTQVLARKREFGIDDERLLKERDARLKIAEARFDHGEVVVGLGNFGIVGDERAKDLRGLFGALHRFEGDRLLEDELRVAGIALDADFGEFERLRRTAVAKESFDLHGEVGVLHRGGELLHFRGGEAGRGEEKQTRNEKGSEGFHEATKNR